MSEPKATQGRRDFLRLAAIAPAAVGAAALTGEQAEAAEPAKGKGLRDTEHSRKYFETARF